MILFLCFIIILLIYHFAVVKPKNKRKKEEELKIEGETMAYEVCKDLIMLIKRPTGNHTVDIMKLSNWLYLYFEKQYYTTLDSKDKIVDLLLSELTLEDLRLYRLDDFVFSYLRDRTQNSSLNYK